MCFTLIPYPAYPSLSQPAWFVPHWKPPDFHHQQLVTRGQPEAEGPTTALGTRTGETCRFGCCGCFRCCSRGSFYIGCLRVYLVYLFTSIVPVFPEPERMGEEYQTRYQNRHRGFCGSCALSSCQGYCTVPHSTCKTGNCFCGKGFVAKNGICEAEPSHDLL